MRISYQNEPLYPGKPAPLFSGSPLYSHYAQSVANDASSSGAHWFDFHTHAPHTLNVRYSEKFYKLVLCIAGNSRSVPRSGQPYGFRTGEALFYQTDSEPYASALAGDTHFQVIHLHLSDAHTALLQCHAPMVFEKPVVTMPLASGCALAFIRLKALSPGPLLRLFEEKLITDQLFTLASRVLGPAPAKDRLQEAIWHIHQSDRYLTIAELSRRVGTNAFQLKKLFREELRTSVFQYQCNLHLDRAARLILDSNLDISAIALQCGYQSASAFSNAFLRKHGQRPLAYKNARSRK